MRFSGLVMVTLVIMMCFGAATPQTLAQTSEQDWTTYIKSQSYSIDYPLFPGQTASITEDSTYSMISHTMITSQPVIITITKTYWKGLMDPQEQAVNHKQNLLQNNTNNVTITQDIFTSVYDGKLGYTNVIFNPKLQTTESYTFIESGNYIYEFNILGMSYNPKTVENINQILGSIKFFD
ncbi:hypothetical protein BH23THE1_BH23THE1_18070 [soil metagenome]